MYHIVCNTDNNYAPYCATMLYSLLNVSKGEYSIHILIDTLNEQCKSRIEESLKPFACQVFFHIVNDEKLNGVKFRQNNPLTKAAYFRLLISSILDESITKVLYLDCDIIVKKDISPLFDIDISAYALAAIRDLIVVPRTEEHRNQLSLSYDQYYFNSGLMIINLEYWRNNDSEKKLIEFAKKERTVYFHDQDALNYVFKGQWYMLPPYICYLNLCLYEQLYFNHYRDFTRYKTDCYVIHYASNEKPWHKLHFYQNKKDFMSIYNMTCFKDTPQLKYGRTRAAYKRILFVNFRNLMYQTPLLIKIVIDMIHAVIYTISFKWAFYTKWKI